MNATTEAGVRGHRPVNRMAVASCVCAVASPLILAPFIVFGALQEIGYGYFFESERYESIARILMLVLSGSAVLLANRAEFEMAISRGLYRGRRLASIGRAVGLGWGGVILFFMLLGLTRLMKL